MLAVEGIDDEDPAAQLLGSLVDDATIERLFIPMTHRLGPEQRRRYGNLAHAFVLSPSLWI